MDEFGEHLRLLEHLDIAAILLRHTLQKAFHIKAIKLSCLFTVDTGRAEVFPICIEQTGEAPDECGPDLVREECGSTGENDLMHAVAVSAYRAGLADVETVAVTAGEGADGAGRVLLRAPVHTMAFDPLGCFRIADGLHEH